MKLKKIFAVILMLSVFLSGCQRQVITGISKNENDVPTSTNTPAPKDYAYYSVLALVISIVYACSYFTRRLRLKTNSKKWRCYARH
ncbi:MAG: hypothetical protein Ta2C_01450 [Candidatus Endomicrobiellum trichonymphae]|nr:MAG: hypothetical protein Ta2C_01450 [Candidatus Endomicrobium trichonymphae]